MKEIIVPETYNYIAVFLTLACNLKCSYCINRFEEGNFNNKHISGDEWVTGLNRIVSRADLPVTLQGGEPALHPGFFSIINNIKNELSIDILTNLKFDVGRLLKEVNPARLYRDAPYANIRVSYHPGQMNLESLISKVMKLQKAGFSIGIFGVLHPNQEEEILTAQKKCLDLGIDFRVKEFLGEYEGKLFGTYLYPESVSKKIRKKCLCKTTELIIGPNGDIYRCHHDLYENFPSVGNILDPEFQIEEAFRKCDVFGFCNPCDVKIKTNRFQQFGHTSVEIKFSDG